MCEVIWRPLYETDEICIGYFAYCPHCDWYLGVEILDGEFSCENCDAIIKSIPSPEYI